ncbi:MAG: ribose 5-phosphate isomerase A [Clostridia bacterium]|nr:ribose 5-phosphate isomerase A [Clostridia bacterium]
MQEFDWKNNVDNREQKQKLAKRIAKRVKDGDIIGFGSGSTSYLAVEEIAKRVHEEGLKIKAIPTSTIIEEICKKLKIETITLSEAKPDWCFDGADEVDPHNWLIKGMGAALYREKMNIKASEENYILVDSSKFVQKLGQNHPVPVECKIDKIDIVKEALKKLGATNVEIKESNVGEGMLITDNGNVLLFAEFPKIEANFEEEINKIDGVVENGLFIGYDLIIIK